MQFSMMLQIPMSKKAIAEAIGVDKSTVYREKSAIATPEVVAIAWSLPSEKQTGASSKNIARKCLHRQ